MKSMLVALMLLVGAQEPAADKIGPLIEKLGADDVEAREQASRDLIALGVGIVPGLEKRIESLPEGEVRVRLKAVVDRLRRLIRIAEVAPKIRTVTASAKGVPLKTLLADLTVQSGVTVECADAVADRAVTVDLNGVSVLEAVDRICLARGDLASTMADGKVKLAAGEPSRSPTAYFEGFRVRFRRKVVTEAGDFAKNRTDIILHAAFDAQPDQKCKSATALGGAEGVSPAGSFKVRAASESPLVSWISSGTRTILTVDDVLLVLDDGDALDLAFIVKDAPPPLRSFDSLKVKARFRYPVGFTPTSIALTGPGRTTMLNDLPYYIHMSQRNLSIYAAQRPGQGAAPPLLDLIDLESLTLVDGAGKENKMTPQPIRGAGRTMHYQWVTEREIKNEEITLKFNVYDAFDREVEFEFKDVKLRD